VTRWLRTIVAILCLCTSGAAWALDPGTPQRSKPPAEPTPTGGISPELETFGRAVTLQARLDQLDYFRSVLQNTDKALQLSSELQRLGASATNIAMVNALSLQLRDDLDEVELYNRRLFISFTKPQEAGLKKLTRQVKRSYSYVERDAKTVQQLMEPGKVVPEQLATGAADLEKALSYFRTDQIRLGREMGIQSK
jgi:hypothetical protein